jgi:glucosylceramidase
LSCGGGSSGGSDGTTGGQTTGSQTTAGTRAGVWLTTGDQKQLLQPQASVAFAADSASNPVTIDVDETKTYQTFDGFGATLTDSAAWLIWIRLSAQQRETLMHQLFDPKSGLGLSFLRHPIGASDLALSNYTYDDVPAGQTDPQLSNFTIAHDLAYMIPVINEAHTLNSALQVIGTSWSPPAWMKTSGSLIGGPLKPDAYEPYANYFVRYLQAYGSQGVTVAGVTPQNEPLSAPVGAPGMTMTSAEEADFIHNHLGPALGRAGLATHIVIWLTECSGTVGSAFAADLRWLTHNLFIGATRAWAKAVLLWSLALDTSSGPQNGGCAACRGVVTIDQASGTITYNVEYYALGHASIAVVPGAHRIDSTTTDGGIETVAFVNPDGSKVLLALNNGITDVTFKVRWSARAFSYSLAAGAVVTFKWP